MKKLSSSAKTAQLRLAYFAYQKAIGALPKKLSGRASAPLLITPHSRWFRCPQRVLIVGQETNGWSSGATTDAECIRSLRQFAECKEGVDLMIEAYRRFDFAKHYPHRNSAFWRAFRSIESRGGQNNGSAMWTNLFKVDVEGPVLKNCTMREIKKLRVAQNGLLAEEVRALRPKTIIFFTGRTYDRDLSEAFPDISLELLWPGVPVTEAARVVSQSLPFMAYRAYHPTYLQRSRRWHTIQRLVEQIQIDDRKAQ